jgi:tetratricopeptide (TPR) repeat protein
MFTRVLLLAGLLVSGALGQTSSDDAEVKVFVTGNPKGVERRKQERAPVKIAQKPPVVQEVKAVPKKEPVPVKTAEEYVQLAKLAIEKQCADDAIQLATKAIDLNPKFADAYDTRAHAYICKGMYREAEADSHKWVACADCNTYMRKAKQLLDTNPDSAFLFATSATNLDPLSKEAFELRAEAYRRQQTKEKGALNEQRNSKN